jgi:hypothetical protein
LPVEPLFLLAFILLVAIIFERLSAHQGSATAKKTHLGQGMETSKGVKNGANSHPLRHASDLLYEAMARLAHNRDLVQAKVEDEVSEANLALREAQRLILEERDLDRARDLIEEVLANLSYESGEGFEESFGFASKLLAWTELEEQIKLAPTRRYWPFRFPQDYTGPVHLTIQPDPGHDGLTLWCSIRWGPHRWTREIDIPAQHRAVLLLKKAKPDSWPLLVEVEPEAKVQSRTGPPVLEDLDILIKASNDEWRQWAREDDPTLGPWSEFGLEP